MRVILTEESDLRSHRRYAKKFKIYHVVPKEANVRRMRHTNVVPFFHA